MTTGMPLDNGPWGGAVAHTVPPSFSAGRMRRLRRTALGIAAALLGPLCLPWAAPAVPAAAAVVELDRDGFAAAASGRTLLTEDFQGFAPGPLPAPLALSNGIVFLGSLPFVAEAPGGDRALLDNTLPLTQARVFAGFAGDGTLAAFELLFGDEDEFDVLVRTVSGDGLLVEARRGRAFDGFFAVEVSGDSLLDIAFTNAGGPSGPGGGGGGIGNFGFDDIATDAQGAGLAVPLPAPGGLLAGALAFGLGLGGRRRGRRGRAFSARRVPRPERRAPRPCPPRG